MFDGSDADVSNWDLFLLLFLNYYLFFNFFFKKEKRIAVKRYCHFVIFVSFCFPCDSGNICRSVNIPKNAGKLTLDNGHLIDALL